MDATSDAGLRERKKRRTRAQIIDVAFALFAADGFERTTIAGIAARAEVAPRTFFSYFPSKEHVLFADHDESMAAFQEALDVPRATDRTALDVLRDWIGEWFVKHPPDHGRSSLVRRLKLEVPSVAAWERSLLARFEDCMTRALADDLGLPADDVRARMAAAAAVAALKCFEPGSGEEEPSPEEGLVRLQDALVFLGAGLAALRDQ